MLKRDDIENLVKKYRASVN